MMDPLAVLVKGITTTTPTSFSLRNSISISEKAVAWNLAPVFEIGVPKQRTWIYSSSPCRSLVIKSMAKKNNGNSSSPSSGNSDKSIPEGDGDGDGVSKKKSSDSNKSKDTASHKSGRISLDWREFRANLFAQELAEKEDDKTESNPNAHKGGKPGSKSLGLKWAHPIPVPETGCVLVATEKLDGVHNFERTVVLLLRAGNRHPQEGPFGVIINRPLYKQMKHMDPTHPELATTFADCPVHFGGPLGASMLLLRTHEKSKPLGHEEVIPGLCYGSRTSLDESARLVKRGAVNPHDFRFFFGYAGWQFDQLREEIESEYWYVAACSPNLICGGPGSSSENSWEEILQLMGGHYSDLSKKPKEEDM